MDAISQLRAAIESALSVTIDAPGLTPQLADELEKLKQLLKHAGGDRPTRDRLREAVLYFREHCDLPNLAVARSVCFGAGEHFDHDEMPLIEEAIAFPRLLELVDGHRSEPRLFRRCYRGLLHTYFAYDAERERALISGRRNWESLRDYLHVRRDSIRCDGAQPDWVEVVGRHPNLLTNDPVARYAPELLRGEVEAVDEIRSRLDISDDSWLMRKLVLAQIHAAASESDESFEKLVRSLLKLLEGHDLLEDAGLTIILNRYSAIRTPKPHASLRDRAVEAWGNPWLERNSPKWTKVVPPARRLVTNWLKLDLIREFFEILSEDRQTDQRRVKFWEGYHEQVDDMYFALGGVAMHARGADATRIRDRMGDHLLSLKKAGPSSNNAFVMMIGKVVAVEFGQKGHACYVYKRDSLPFELRREVLGDRDGLRSLDHLERLLHFDRGHEKWEERFADALERYGVKRPDRRVPSRSRPQARASSHEGSLTQNVFAQFCRTHNLTFVDNTGKGGNIAVRYPLTAGGVSIQLRSWGFEYSEKREFWWRKGW